jgi:hypothetical protein
MSYWSWAAVQAPASGTANALEPRTSFDVNVDVQVEKTTAPADKKPDSDGMISGYVCLIHVVD